MNFIIFRHRFHRLAQIILVFLLPQIRRLYVLIVSLLATNFNFFKTQISQISTNYFIVLITANYKIVCIFFLTLFKDTKFEEIQAKFERFLIL